MNNFIIINRTFAEATPESSEYGDFSDSGFIEEHVEVTFSELVRLMRDHWIPSCSPNGYDTHVWYSTSWYTRNYMTGTEREECIHYSHHNTPNCEKYWKWARIIADKKNKR